MGGRFGDAPVPGLGLPAVTKRLILEGIAALAIGLTACSATGRVPMAAVRSVVVATPATTVAPITLDPDWAPPPGSSVRDGMFEFRVATIERLKQVCDPNGYTCATAQGEFIVVTMQVTNIGNQARTYFSSNQKLIGVDGQQFRSDPMGDVWVNFEVGGAPTISPGNWV